MRGGIFSISLGIQQETVAALAFKETQRGRGGADRAGPGVVERVVDLPHPAVQFVVGDAAPVLGLLEGHRLGIDDWRGCVHLGLQVGRGQRQDRLVLLRTVGGRRSLRAQREGRRLGLLAGWGDTAGAGRAGHAGQGGER